MPRKFGQNGRLVAKPGADLEKCLVPFRSKQVCHEGTHEGLGDRLFEADRQRHILIRKMGQSVGNEKVSRCVQHRRQDPLVKHAFPKFFLDQVGVDSNDLDHVPTQDCEVFLIHRLHAIRPWLRCDPLPARSRGLLTEFVASFLRRLTAPIGGGGRVS
jgi:hypothetical protein